MNGASKTEESAVAAVRELNLRAMQDRINGMYANALAAREGFIFVARPHRCDTTAAFDGCSA